LATTQSPAEPPTPITISEFPDPPVRIANLVKLGEVTFEWGGQSEQRSAERPQLIAETHYRIAFGYNSRSRWRIDRARQQVVVTVRFHRISWRPNHRIWF